MFTFVPAEHDNDRYANNQLSRVRSRVHPSTVLSKNFRLRHLIQTSDTFFFQQCCLTSKILINMRRMSRVIKHQDAFHLSPSTFSHIFEIDILLIITEDWLFKRFILLLATNIILFICISHLFIGFIYVLL